MSRPQRLRYHVFEDVREVDLPNIPDVGSPLYASLRQVLDLFSNLAIGHGSHQVKDDVRGYWTARFEEHEFQAVLNWFSWHAQYERVSRMNEIFLIDLDTVGDANG